MKMKRKILLILTCFTILTAYFTPGHEVKSATIPPLVIKEVMADPIGDDSLYEWLELQNTSAQTVQLNLYKINGTKLPTAVIQPQEIFMLSRNTNYLFSRYPDLSNSAFNFSFSLANAGGSVNLTDNTDSVLQSFTYGQTQEGKSYELLEGNCNQILLNTSTVGNTIGKPNTQCYIPTSTPTNTIITTPAPTNAISKYSNLVEISQVRPCSSIGALIINNNDTYNIDLTKWILDVDDKKSMYLADMVVNAKSYIIVTFPEKFLPNSGARITIIDPSGNQKDVFKYPKCNNSNDYFEIASANSSVSINSSNVQPTSLTIKYPRIYDKTE